MDAPSTAINVERAKEIVAGESLWWWTALAHLDWIAEGLYLFPDWFFNKYLGGKNYTKWFGGKRLTTFWLIVVIGGHLIDDWGTAIGMQATEEFGAGYAMEGNGSMIGLWKKLEEWGLAKTHTAAHRLVGFWYLATILFAQYFGLWTFLSRTALIVTSVYKAYAGYGWWSLTPNDYTVFDFITFQDGKQTDNRLPGSYLSRRRLGEQEPMLGQVKKIIDFLFRAATKSSFARKRKRN